jgi:predicted ArsR family transcriptional regulator
LFYVVNVNSDDLYFIRKFKMNVTTKSGKLLEALQAGEKLTAKQISARFGIKNPTATVSDLRFSGYAIYANQHKDTNGRQTTKYRLGNPSRRIVAAGYRAMAAGLV